MSQPAAAPPRSARSHNRPPRVRERLRGPRHGGEPRHVQVAIVGTGFSGLGTAIRLQQAGIEDYVVLERADDVGGTWRDNTYPGAACDVPSHLYSFSFAPNPHWTRTFSGQGEILAYLRDCARRHGVLPRVKFGHEVTDAAWEEEEQRWRVETTKGTFYARALVSGMGALAEPSTPTLPGLERFTGKVFHSARWDHDHELSGERVAVIGTGASAIQFVPQIQPRVGKLHLFQRTAPWIVPRTDRAITSLERAAFQRLPFLQRLVRQAIYWGRETFVLGFAVDRRFMKLPRRLAMRQLRRQVKDPQLRARLTPRYEIGCKRILISNDYYPALNRDNVEVVTDGIREVRERSIVTADGTERAVDTIVLGTGFRVIDSPMYRRIRGRHGRSLTDSWEGSLEAYLGTTVAGFPNLFLMTGPNTGLGHTSMTIMIEAQIEYVLGALRAMDEQGLSSVEVRRELQDAYNERLQAEMRDTVWTTGGCASWYLDADGKNRTLWPTFTHTFRRRTRRFEVHDYHVRSGARERLPIAA